MKKDEKGFSVVESLLTVVIIGLVVGVGWYVWQSRKDNNAATPVNTQTSSPSSNESPDINTQALEPLEGSQNLYDLSELATTQDQKDISASILAYCISLKWEGVDKTNGRVAAAKDIFGNPNLYTATSANARVSASCYSTALSKDKQPTGRKYLLHKDNSTKQWKVDSAGQMLPSCTQVDGLGYTTEVVPECSEGTTARAPKP